MPWASSTSSHPRHHRRRLLKKPPLTTVSLSFFILYVDVVGVDVRRAERDFVPCPWLWFSAQPPHPLRIWADPSGLALGFGVTLMVCHPPALQRVSIYYFYRIWLACAADRWIR